MFMFLGIGAHRRIDRRALAAEPRVSSTRIEKYLEHDRERNVASNV